MKMARKRDIGDTVNAFCNQKALNEQSQTENKLWTSLLFYSVCLFGVDFEVGYISPVSSGGNCNLLLWSCPFRIFSPRQDFQTVNEKFRKFMPRCFHLFFLLSRVSSSYCHVLLKDGKMI